MEIWRIDLEAFPSPLTSYAQCTACLVQIMMRPGHGGWRQLSCSWIFYPIAYLHRTTHRCISPVRYELELAAPFVFSFLPGIPCTLVIAIAFCYSKRRVFLVTCTPSSVRSHAPLRCPSDKNKINSSPRPSPSQAVNI